MDSQNLFMRAKAVIPGGVNSPVRAYGSVGMTPRFIREASGARITDVEGRTYIDYIGSWGPMIVGHTHPKVLEAVKAACDRGLSFGAATALEVEIAEYICARIPSIEMIRMVNSGTEAVMSAVRAARGYTGRDKLIKFAGCYHGHSDAMLVKAGSGVMTGGMPDSAGVPEGCAKDTLTAVYNDLDSVEACFSQADGKVAALIVEPVAANMGVVLPEEGFLAGLRSLCDKYGTVLIFDEVITGFRLGFTGAQGRFGVTPDLTTYGKIIGGGMPVGAYGGKKEIMEMVSPCGPVYQAGTLSGNPIAMTAGLVQLQLLYENPDIYEHLEAKGELLFSGIIKAVQDSGVKAVCNHIGSLGCLFFTDQAVRDYESAKTADTQKFSQYFAYMLDHGSFLAPSQFEAMFLSAAHTESDIQETIKNVEAFLQL